MPTASLSTSHDVLMFVKWRVPFSSTRHLSFNAIFNSLRLYSHAILVAILL